MNIKNKYTVIIPTMYFNNEELGKMLLKYEECPYIHEVLIINNNKTKKKVFSGKKIRTIGIGINMFVIPSWKLGVTLARTDNVIIANDDIVIEGDFSELMEQINDFSLPGKIIGPSEHCYKEKGLYEGAVQIWKSKSINFTHGFGAFMIVTKNDYLNTTIPEGIKVWYGDMILYEKLKPYYFEGVEIVTEFMGTTKRIDLNGVAKNERLLYLRTR